jgi:hypothetical protein
LDLAWKSAKLVSANIHSTGGTNTRVRLGERSVPITLRPGQTKKITEL